MKNISEQLTAYAQARWQARAQLLTQIPGLEEAEESAGAEERVWFRYLVGTLPLQDLSQYRPETLLGFARHGAMLCREMAWCGSVPEESFAKYVVCPRVNDEALSPCREEFYHQLLPWIEGLSLEEAIQAVNVWCCSHVTYRATDGRTSSALDIYHRGYGRCGEESVFAVNALRSVGIAARQVYAPRWSHCDDNHAWVEAWDGNAWRFLGACEPEPRLDMGWFTAAAGRAMLANTKAFVTGAPQEWGFLFPEAEEGDLDCREGLVLESVTPRYAETMSFTVGAVDSEGQPMAGVSLGFYILNEGALWEIARRKTGADGQARLNLGLGSLWIRVLGEEGSAEALVNTGQVSQITLTLPGKPMPPGFGFAAPADRGLEPVGLSEEERRARAAVLEDCRIRREKWIAQNKRSWPESLGEIADSLTQKDRDDGPEEAVLADALPAMEYRERLLDQGMTDEEFRATLLSPRICQEPLAPWRQLLSQVLPGLTPLALWAATQAHRALEMGWEALPQTPAGAWLTGPVNAQAREALFCALCRARGIPARPGIAGPEYWDGSGFCPVEGLPPGEALIQGEKPQGGSLGLMRIEKEGLRPLEPAEPETPILLPPGEYRVIAATRLPNGNQLGEYYDFTVESGETAQLTVEFPRGRPEELLQRLALPDMPLARGKTSLWALLRESALSLMCWIEPGSEPTQHLVNELEAQGKELEALGCQAHLMTGEEESAEAVARRMYLEPGRLPLVVLADRQGNGLYACAGYNVGLVELAAGLAALAREQEE